MRNVFSNIFFNLISRPIVWVLPTFVLIALLYQAVYANSDTKQGDLGVVGKLYPVAERSFLAVLMDRLHQAQESGEMTAIETAARERWQAYATAPPGKHYPRAAKGRIRLLDMTLTLDHDVGDHDGKVFAKAGTQVNPLSLMQLSKVLVLFDGTDAAQVKWAKQYVQSSKKPIKAILTNGKVLEMMEQWQSQLWFDQGGYLGERFRIEYLPAILSQDGTNLKLEEIVVHD